MQDFRYHEPPIHSSSHSEPVARPSDAHGVAGVRLSFGYQFIVDPAYNRDRGSKTDFATKLQEMRQ
jgi:hypothetical protein